VTVTTFNTVTHKGYREGLGVKATPNLTMHGPTVSPGGLNICITYL